MARNFALTHYDIVVTFNNNSETFLSFTFITLPV